jgi:hypothetical protein
LDILLAVSDQNNPWVYDLVNEDALFLVLFVKNEVSVLLYSDGPGPLLNPTLIVLAILLAIAPNPFLENEGFSGLLFIL